MKKLIYCALALAAGLFAASCQQENLEPVAQENTVTYTVELPDVQTKTIGDGLNVDQLVYEVWKTGENGELSTRLYQKTINLPADAPRKWIVTLNLVQNQTYKALFWAQVGEADAYNTENLTKVYLDKNLEEDYLSNQESYAAFYGTDVLDTNTPLKGKTITLTRPFAQLNIGTLNTADEKEYSIKMDKSSVVVTVPTQFNVATSKVANPQEITFNLAKVPTAPATLPVSGTDYGYVAMNYVFAGEKTTSSVEYTIETTITPTASASTATTATINKTIYNVPLKENYRTNIVGNLLTSSAQYEVVIDKNFNDQADEFEGGKYGVINGKQFVRVENIEEFNAAVANANVDIVILQNDIVLSETLTRSASDPTITISADKELTIDLNGKKLSATSTQTGKNYNMFDVRGTLTVKNGTIEYQHAGENMEWNNFAEIFYVGFNGTLNLDGVTAVNNGGSDMAYIIDMVNATNITVNVQNSTLESTYIPVRVFNNSKTGVNNVTIKNSTLKGKYCFWVQYWLADDRDAATLKNTLKLDIFSEENVYEHTGAAPIIYGFNTTYYGTTNGITKSVSEDGTVVTLGTMVENGVVARGVAGEEENRTITKAIVGEGITTLYDRTFRRFYALETVELPSTLTTIGAAGTGVFQSCNALKNIVIPESVTVLGEGTFKECSALESINIPAGITSINKDTFNASGIKSIEFHEGVTYFGAQAFRDCKQLTEVIIKAPEFTIEGNTFGILSGPRTKTTVHVANAEMKAYVESKLSSDAKLHVTVVAPVETTEGLMGALEGGATLINVAAGEYTFPTSSIKDNQKIIGVDGTIFNVAGASISADNVTIKGVTFQNDGKASCALSLSGKNPVIEDCVFKGAAPNGHGVIVIGNGDADNVITLKNCDFSQDDFFKPVFDGWTGLKGSTLVIDRCILANGLYAMHIDGNKQNGSIIVKNSHLAGFVTNGASLDSVTFENCTFGVANGYACVNIFTAHSFVNCTFPTKADANNVSNYGLYVGSNAAGKDLVISNCKMSDGTVLDQTNVAVANGGFVNWDSDTEAMNVTIK